MKRDSWLQLLPWHMVMTGLSMTKVIKRGLLVVLSHSDIYCTCFLSKISCKGGDSFKQVICKSALYLKIQEWISRNEIRTVL